MFEANNIFIKSSDKLVRDNNPEGFIEGDFHNGRVHVYGNAIRVLESFIPIHDFVASKTLSGSEGQETKLISLSRDKAGKFDKQAAIIHETSPFYVEEPDRKKARLRLGEMIIK